jgi:hypothetical protein
MSPELAEYLRPYDEKIEEKVREYLDLLYGPKD